MHGGSNAISCCLFTPMQLAAVAEQRVKCKSCTPYISTATPVLPSVPLHTHRCLLFVLPWPLNPSPPHHVHTCMHPLHCMPLHTDRCRLAVAHPSTFATPTTCSVKYVNALAAHEKKAAMKPAPKKAGASKATLCSALHLHNMYVSSSVPLHAASCLLLPRPFNLLFTYTRVPRPHPPISRTHTHPGEEGEGCHDASCQESSCSQEGCWPQGQGCQGHEAKEDGHEEGRCCQEGLNPPTLLGWHVAWRLPARCEATYLV